MSSHKNVLPWLALAAWAGIMETGTVQAEDIAPEAASTSIEDRLDAIEHENAVLRQRLDDALSQAAAGYVTTPRDLVSASHIAAQPPPPCDTPVCDGFLSEGAANGSDKEDPLEMFARWNNGLELQTKDKKFRVHVGGRWQVDAIFIQDDPEALFGVGGTGDADSVNFRRARLRVDGTMYEFIDWAMEYDFVNSNNVNPGTPVNEANLIDTTGITDLWIQFKTGTILGNIKIGSLKEPLGFEHLTSSRYLDFLERSYNQDAFYGGFNNGFSPGILFQDTYDDEYGTWTTSFAKNTLNNAGNIFGYGFGDGEYAWSSRMTYLPYFEDEGAKLFHLGISGSLRDPNNASLRFRARGALRNAPNGAPLPVLVDTGNFAVEGRHDLLGAEAVFQYESLLLQAEYMGSFAHDASFAAAPLGTVFSQGWYVEALYFLTGEHRHYERATGVFGRVVPHENFSISGGGLGGWQVGGRYSQLDLRDAGLDGGIVQDVTLGLNWFMNPNLKLQANYVYTVRDPAAAVNQFGREGFHGFGMRIAHDF